MLPKRALVIAPISDPGDLCGAGDSNPGRRMRSPYRRSDKRNRPCRNGVV